MGVSGGVHVGNGDGRGRSAVHVDLHVPVPLVGFGVSEPVGCEGGELGGGEGVGVEGGGVEGFVLVVVSC